MFYKAENMVQLGDQYLQNRFFQNAIDTYTKALEFEKDQSVYEKLRIARIAYADHLYAVSEFKKARRLYKCALQMDVTDSIAKNKIALCYVAIAEKPDTKIREAYNNLKSAFRYDDSFEIKQKLDIIETKLVKIMSKDLKGNTETTKQFLEGNTYYILGVKASSEKNYNKAIKYFEISKNAPRFKAAYKSCESKLLLAYFDYAKQLKNEEQYETALIYFDKFKPNTPEQCYMETPEDKEINEKVFESYLHIAECYFAIGKAAFAKADYTTAFKNFEHTQKHPDVAEKLNFFLIDALSSNLNIFSSACTHFAKRDYLSIEGNLTLEHIQILKAITQHCPDIRTFRIPHIADDLVLKYFCNTFFYNCEILELHITATRAQYINIIYQALKNNVRLLGISIDLNSQAPNETEPMPDVEKLSETNIFLLHCDVRKIWSGTHGYYAFNGAKRLEITGKINAYYKYFDDGKDPDFKDPKFPLFSVRQLYWTKFSSKIPGIRYQTPKGLAELYLKREMEYTTYALFRASTVILNQDSMKCIFRYLDDISICSLKLLGIILKKEEAQISHPTF